MATVQTAPSAKGQALRWSLIAGIIFAIAVTIFLARCNGPSNANRQQREVSASAPSGSAQGVQRSAGQSSQMTVAARPLQSSAATCANFTSVTQSCLVTDACTGWISANGTGPYEFWPNDQTVWGRVQYMVNGVPHDYDFANPPPAGTLIDAVHLCAPAGRTVTMIYRQRDPSAVQPVD